MNEHPTNSQLADCRWMKQKQKTVYTNRKDRPIMFLQGFIA